MGKDFRLRKFKINKGISFRNILDEFVVVNSQGGEILTLNEVGGRILELLEEENSLEKIIVIISGEFDTTPKIVENDMKEYINSLIEVDIIIEND